MVTTKEYYNTISDLLVDIKYYYNGSLILDDIDSDPNSFIEQDFNNVIKLSNLGSSVLEFGCGTGYFFKRLIEKYPTINYHGFDLSENQIKNAKSLNPGHEEKFSVIDWNLGLPFKDNSFDTLLFLETIGYTTNLNKLISECYRVLKPGGTLFSKHPGCTNTKAFYHILVQQDLKKISDEYGYEDNSLGMMMDVPKFIKSLEQNNFSVPEGYQIPIVDTSTHIKSFFKDEIKPFLEEYKLSSNRIAASSPKKIPISFEWNSIGNELSKYHPNTIEMFRHSFFVNNPKDSNTSEEIFHPCVVFTAYKK